MVQEVDNLHSRIENQLKGVELFSPLGVMKQLILVKGLHITQLSSSSFFDFMSLANMSERNFEKIPYTRVRVLKYEKCDPKMISYKTSFNAQYTKVQTGFVMDTRTLQSNESYCNNLFKALKCIPQSARPAVCAAKKNDIKAMLAYMPAADKAYMKADDERSACTALSSMS